MDESLKTILDSLPPKASRSKLEPYRELIRELRRRGRSYQEITDILRDRCGVTAAVHSVYNFVRVREKADKGTRPKEHGGGRSTDTARPTELAEGERALTGDDAWKNIQKLKQQQSATTTEEKVFVYNEDEPLKLVRGISQSSDARDKTKPKR
ncbi:MAG TPA: hypothetical protein VKB79_30195 [Bryobacteraceae bacterium]|nr:hypothetical protein [Bryobacteraceae bacterium]